MSAPEIELPLIGPYRLEQRLAAGGMGEVWRAWDSRLKRPVAMKHVLPHLLDHPGARERFRREAEAGARLSHPAVVQIYDLVESPEGDWLVMELVDGGTVRELLEEGPLPWRQAVRWGREIAEGLAAAHAQGLLHRDLKAGNVIVTRGGHAKVLDFGLVRSLDATGDGGRAGQESSLSQPGVVLGTSYAMSPEQVLGLPLDQRSDLFALGSLLYEMCAGDAPFRADAALNSLARVCHYQPPPLRERCPEAPAALSELVRRLLAKEPLERPAGAAEVAALLEEIAAAPRRGAPATPPVVQEPPADDEATWAAPRPQPAERGPAAPSSSWTPRPGDWRGVLSALVVLALIALAWRGWAPPAREPAAGPTAVFQLYQRGLAAFERNDQKGRLDQAIADFREILARDPRHAAAHAALARCYLAKLTNDSKDRQWLALAEPLARKAVTLDPYLASARVALAMVHTAAGRLGEAEDELARALGLEPAGAEGHYALAAVHEARSRLEPAEAELRQAIALEPDRRYYDSLGALYARTGRLEQAIEAFGQSIRLAPDGYIGYRNLGTAYYLQGRPSDAAAQFQRALEIQPEPSLYTNLGTLYFSQGLYADAADAFERALELPGGANDPLFWGNLGDACRWLVDGGPRAREAYGRALQLLAEQSPAGEADVTTLSRRTLYLAKRGDCPPALAAADDAGGRAGIDAISLYRLLVARELCGRRDQALTTLEAALAAGLPALEIQRDPELLALRGDPRYHRLMLRLGPAPPTL